MESAAVQRIAHKLRAAATTIKANLFHHRWPPRRDSFMRWLGGSWAGMAAAILEADTEPAPPYVRHQRQQQRFA